VGGYEALVTLRQDSRTSGVPIILMSAKSGQEHIRHALELGANDYLSKPFTISEVVEAINVRITQQEKQQGNGEGGAPSQPGQVALGLPADVRAPMSGILGFSEVLTRDYEPLRPAEMVEMGRAIRKAGKKLQRVIQNFSIVAQLEILVRDPEAKKQLTNGKRSDVKRLVRDVVNDKALKLDRKDDVSLELEDAAVAMSDDYVRLVVIELLDNAFKFSERGKKLAVSGKKSKGVYQLSIADSGSGMTDEQLSDILKDRSFHDRLQALQGFDGLVIARRLVEIHDGTLSLARNSDDGVTATITIPVA